MPARIFLAGSRRAWVLPRATGSRFISTKDTLLLPKTKFVLWSDPRDDEFRQRTTEDLYKWQSDNNKGPLFVTHDGPPYANGDLHMGHAMNKVLKDIINRYHVLQGRRVNYIPGWDCHGLPIENKVLAQLEATPNSLPPSRVRETADQFAREQVQNQRTEFIKMGVMADWSPEGTYRTIDHDYEIRQLYVFKEMVEKDLIYRKHKPVHWSPSSMSALAEAEVQYVDDHTSLSAYVSFRIPSPEQMSKGLRAHAEEAGVDKIDLLIWTTTPWTLPANMAIAVNPALSYSLVRRPGQPPVLIAEPLLGALSEIIDTSTILATLSGETLLGTTYEHIFRPPGHHLRILPSRHVSSEAGTGLVHMAPAHGAEDYAVFTSVDNSDVVCPVDKEGRYTQEILDLAVNEEHGKRLVGKEVLYGGNKEILRILGEAGVLINQKKYKHKYPYDWRTKKPMIVRATSQWFANVGQIKNQALQALESVNFYPESFSTSIARNRLNAFVRERAEWCISRQRVWGIPIPALHDAETGEAFMTPSTLEHIIGILEEKGITYWWDGPVEEFVPPSLAVANPGRQWVKGTDTVDVWFDSGTSWTMLRSLWPGDAGSPSNAEGLQVANVALEGSDQHRGWFQSLLLTAIATTWNKGKTPIAPYKDVITHGFVLDESGKKMSKSLGNIISPRLVLEGGKDRKKEPAYGADVLRYWAAGLDYTRDVVIGPKVLATTADYLRKLRNTFRFILSNTNDGQRLQEHERVPKDQMGLLDRYVMHQLYLLETSSKHAYDTYSFHSVVRSVQNFSSITCSALYFDVTKDILYAESVSSLRRRTVLTVLEEILDTLTSVIAPIAPHLAEEIHDVPRSEGMAITSIFQQGWKSVDPIWQDSKTQHEMEQLLGLRDLTLLTLEHARRQGRIRSALEADIEVSGLQEGHGLSDILRREADTFQTLCIVSGLTLVDLPKTNGLSTEESPSHAPHNPAHGSSNLSAEDNWAITSEPHEGLVITVRHSSDNKCPRCWQWTAPAESNLCHRCSTVVESLAK